DLPLARDLHGFRLAEHGHANLAGVRQGLFDGRGNVARQLGRFAVVDAAGVDDDADFAAGLNGEGLVHAGEAAGDRFEFLQSLDVAVEAFATSTRSRRGDRIGGSD